MMISNLVILLFAPSFLLLVHYFNFKKVVSGYIFISLIMLLFFFIKKKKVQDYIVLSVYIILLSVAYFFTSFSIVKLIPTLISLAFFTLFTQAAAKKQALIYKVSKRFYKKKFTPQEIAYLKKGDAYWALVILLFMIGQVIVVFFASNVVWAFYSSIGWYIYFIVALILQILYGKMYAIKMSV